MPISNEATRATINNANEDPEQVRKGREDRRGLLFKNIQSTQSENEGVLQPQGNRLIPDDSQNAQENRRRGARAQDDSTRIHH